MGAMEGYTCRPVSHTFAPLWGWQACTCGPMFYYFLSFFSICPQLFRMIAHNTNNNTPVQFTILRDFLCQSKDDKCFWLFLYALRSQIKNSHSADFYYNLCNGSDSSSFRSVFYVLETLLYIHTYLSCRCIIWYAYDMVISMFSKTRSIS